MSTAKAPSLKKNVVLSSLKTVTNIILPLITYPYVSRVLGVDALGSVNYAHSIISYLMLIGAFGFQSYAIREGSRVKNDPAAFEQFGREIHTINAVAVLIAYSLLGLMILFAPKLKANAVLLLIQSLSVAFYSISTEWINNVYEDFAYVTYRSIAIQIVLFICTMVFVRTADDVYIYAGILTMSYVLTGIMNRIYCRKKFRLRLTRHIKSLKHHLIPMIQVFFSQVTITIYLNADKTMLGAILGDHSVGLYSVAVKVYEVVKQVFSAVFIVILPRMSSLFLRGDRQHEEELRQKILELMFVLIPPLAMGVFVLSKPAVLFLGGERYMDAEITLKYLSVALMLSAFATYSTQILAIPTGRYGIIAIATSTAAALNVLLNFFLIPHYGPNGAAMTTILSELVVTLIIWLVLRPKIHVKPVIPYMLFGIGECVYIYLTHAWIADHIKNVLVECFMTVFMAGIPYIPIALHLLKQRRRRA